jgi:hypothetical protein
VDTKTSDNLINTNKCIGNASAGSFLRMPMGPGHPDLGCSECPEPWVAGHGCLGRYRCSVAGLCPPRLAHSIWHLGLDGHRVSDIAAVCWGRFPPKHRAVLIWSEHIWCVEPLRGTTCQGNVCKASRGVPPLYGALS